MSCEEEESDEREGERECERHTIGQIDRLLSRNHGLYCFSARCYLLSPNSVVRVLVSHNQERRSPE